VGLVNVGIAAFYYLNIVRTMFFTDEKGTTLIAPIGIQISLVICTVVTVWMGTYPATVIGWVNTASAQLLAIAQ
ncbi:MAG: hypothetical protein WAU10_25585, partial [Caldilineaceae bacterium]